MIFTSRRTERTGKNMVKAEELELAVSRSWITSDEVNLLMLMNFCLR